VTNFVRTPLIQSDPYGYGEPDAPPVAVLTPGRAAAPVTGG
jgi:hypothetical protein